MSHRSLAVALTLVLALLSPVHADRFDTIRRHIKQALVNDQVPSLAVAVARDGKILWEQGFGWADRENRVPATKHTMYSLASISKPFTATGLMVLVERGKLDLDRPANEYLGDAKLTAHVGDASQATLRRLANHTSGLPLHYQFFYADQPYRAPPRDVSIRRYGQLVTAPGERYQYANLGYGILDYLIARHGGMSYAAFMRREVFLPLGLTHTSVDLGPRLKKYQAIRYAPNQTPLPFYTFDHPGASAVYSSAHDLVRFGLFHLKQPGREQKPILSQQSIDEMQRPTAKRDDGSGYGIGWAIDPDEYGVRTVSHSGGMGGVRTRLVLVPDEKIVVVTLCNFSSQLPMDIAHEILAELIPTYRKNWQQRKKNPSSDRRSPNFEIPDNLLGPWSGKVHTYRGDVRLQLWFKPAGDVYVQLGDQLRTLLNQPRFDGQYLTGVFAGDIGTGDANRRPYHLHLRVKLRDQVLNGSLTAISLPGPRAGNALSYWVEVKKR
jgi:CubicO group peptidase (beta-lactamase class C family)